MNVYLLRHAHAVDGTGADFDRTLSDKGRKQAEKMGLWLRKILPVAPLFLSSPYPRALETATIVAGSWEDATVRRDERLASGMRPDEGVALIHEMGGGEEIFLVGHSPDLDRLAAHLLGCPEGGVAVKKGAVAAFECRRAGAGGAVLHWLINPSL